MAAMVPTPTTEEAMTPKIELKPAGVAAGDPMLAKKPNVAGFKFVGGKKSEWSGPLTDVTSPIFDLETGKRSVIGSLPDMSPEDAVEAVNAAAAAWDKGQGAWPQMSLAMRIAAIEKFVEELAKSRQSMVDGAPPAAPAPVHSSSSS